MNLFAAEQFLLVWIVVASIWAFAMFGFDKSRARQAGRRRVPEFTLCWVSALGGWPGGFLGLKFFRHKSSKRSFLFKFAFAFLIWTALILAVLKSTGRW